MLDSNGPSTVAPALLPGCQFVDDPSSSWSTLRISPSELCSMPHGNFRVSVYEHADNGRSTSERHKYYYVPINCWITAAPSASSREREPDRTRREGGGEDSAATSAAVERARETAVSRRSCELIFRCPSFAIFCSCHDVSKDLWETFFDVS